MSESSFSNLLRLGRLQPRQALCGLILAPIFFLAMTAAYWIRFDESFGAMFSSKVLPSALVAVAVKLVVFAALRMLGGWGRIVTFQDLILLVKAATISAAILVVVHYALFNSLAGPRSVLIFDWCLTIFLVGAARAAGRFLTEQSDYLLGNADWSNVFIAGADSSGEALLRAIRLNRGLPYRVVGFLSDRSVAIHSQIGGAPVVGTFDQLAELARRYRVEEVLIASGELSGRQVRELVEAGQSCRVHVKVLPSYDQLLQGTVDLKPRTVSIEDLLRRDPVRLDLRELHQWLDARVLMVTGSAGSIGSEVCRQLTHFAPKKIVLVDRSENGQFFLERELRALAPQIELETCLADLNDKPRMEAIFAEYRPEIIFHAAAYKHVPLMEAHPGEAVKNIVLSTRALADLADRHGALSFVMISTDKAVNPTSVMGSCKRVAELYVQSLAQQSQCRFVTVRFGNVLDSAGSVVPIFREQIARGGPITITHPDMRRYFMTIPEASQLVIQAGAMGQGGEIFVLDMGAPVKIVDLAEDMIRLSGLKVGDDIDIEFVGVRPGEKLFEELNVDGERHVATNHPKIMVAVCASMAHEAIGEAIDRLGELSDSSRHRVRPALREIVPQFQFVQTIPFSKALPAEERPMRRAA